MGEFIYLLPNVVCMCVFVCLFVCYKKGFITFDPDNAKFTQKDQWFHGKGNKLYSTEHSAELTEKSFKMCSVAMKNCILFTGD